jgi:hypothetical protein
MPPQQTQQDHDIQWWVPLFELAKKVITQKSKTKLNSDCTIRFLLINPSKQDLI